MNRNTPQAVRPSARSQNEMKGPGVGPVEPQKKTKELDSSNATQGKPSIARIDNCAKTLTRTFSAITFFFFQSSSKNAKT